MDQDLWPTDLPERLGRGPPVAIHTGRWPLPTDVPRRCVLAYGKKIEPGGGIWQPVIWGKFHKKAVFFDD